MGTVARDVITLKIVLIDFKRSHRSIEEAHWKLKYVSYTRKQKQLHIFDYKKELTRVRWHRKIITRMCNDFEQ